MGKYTFRFAGTVYELEMDPAALPTTTLPPNVEMMFVPLLADEANGRLYRGETDFHIDTTGATGDDVGTLYRCVA